MNANELTFGIEFETTVPRGVLTVGSYTRGQQVPFLPQGWVAKYDASIVATGHRQGCEIVSPILKGTDGLEQVLTVLRALNERGFKVNSSCGLHIHVGGFNRDAETVARITSIVSNFEKAIFAATGTKKRERGRWCGSIQRHGNANVAIASSRSFRYHVLNLTKLDSFGTVEFRAFGGSLNATKVTGYIRMCLGLVERATETSRKTNWTAKTPKESSPIARSGEGHTAIARLFYQLGWTKGRASKVYGDVATADSPSVKEVKKEFVRLAKKYDSE